METHRDSQPGGEGFGTVTIVGVGLIGGSLAAALRRVRGARRLIGVGRSVAKLQKAVDTGLLDEATDDLAEAAGRSDVVVICTPVDRIVNDVRVAAQGARPGTLLTDAGSTKAEICAALSACVAPGVEFLGAHPIAGSEKQGYEFADAHLYERRVTVLTPVAGSSDTARQRLRRMWESVGASVLEMSPADHDAALARTSHLPHLVAAVLAGTLPPEHFAVASTGFRDTTRIASGDPDLWTSILLANRSSILAAAGEFEALWREFTTALVCEEAARLRSLFETAKRRRDDLLASQAATAPTLPPVTHPTGSG